MSEEESVHVHVPRTVKGSDGEDVRVLSGPPHRFHPLVEEDCAICKHRHEKYEKGQLVRSCECRVDFSDFLLTGLLLFKTLCRPAMSWICLKCWNQKKRRSWTRIMLWNFSKSHSIAKCGDFRCCFCLVVEAGVVFIGERPVHSGCKFSGSWNTRLTLLCFELCLLSSGGKCQRLLGGKEKHIRKMKVSN
jgi:hypothetical protein